MSISSIKTKTRIQLWSRAAGRCQYENCNVILWRDELTMSQMNRAYIAHIVADKPGGPRGDKIRSPLLADKFSNLMLLCDAHHRLIDKEDVDGHPEERLVAMKASHEKRIEMVTGIIANSNSHVILYGANIGIQNTPLTGDEVHTALLPSKYPARSHPFEIGFSNSSFYDNEEEYWKMESTQLTRKVKQEILSTVAGDTTKHLSVFALAPQPLLIQLGTLLTDLQMVDVFQRHREPTTWEWQENIAFNGFELQEPDHVDGIPVLNLSLSATITKDRIEEVFEEPISIWTITHDKPHNDFLKSREILSQFKSACRVFFNKVKAMHGQNSTLHVFPAMPVSAAIEFGRVRMPKADLGMIIYDQNNKTQGFVQTLSL